MQLEKAGCWLHCPASWLARCCNDLTSTDTLLTVVKVGGLSCPPHQADTILHAEMVPQASCIAGTPKGN